MAEVGVRIVVALVAVVVIAAMAVQLRVHDVIAHAQTAAIQPHPTVATARAQASHLRSIESIRPGAAPFLAAAALDLRTAQYARARRDALAATRREPRNFISWVTLGVAAGALGHNRERNVAFARAHALNPRYPIPR